MCLILSSEPGRILDLSRITSVTVRRGSSASAQIKPSDYLIDSMGMDLQKAAAEQKAGERQELVDALVEALDGGKSLWNGRSLRVYELGLDEDGWGNMWNMRSCRGSVH